MIHMLLGLFLAISSTAFASDKSTTIRLSGSSDLIFTSEYGVALYMAESAACQELKSRHGIPYFGAKEKRTRGEISGAEITFEHVSRGLCNFKFANLYASFAIGKAKSSVTIYHDKKAGDEAQIICKTPAENARYLDCRTSDGKYGQGLGFYLNMESKNEKTIHVDLE